MKKNCTIYLVRHGETDWNVKSIIQGHSDISLNEKGKTQAKQLLKILDHIKFDAVFSSDLIRAKHTAQVIAKKKNLKIQTTKALRERDFGVYEGKSFIKYGKEIISLLNRFRKTIQTKEEKSLIETDESIINRLVSFLKKVAKKYLGKNVLMVSHGGTMRCFLIFTGLATYKSLPAGSINNLGYLKLISNGEEFSLVESSGINKKLTS